MILKFNDRTEMYVSEGEGSKIRTALSKSASGFITVRGTTFNKTSIMKIEEGGVDPNKVISFFDPKTPTLPAGPTCKGQYSIQREINDVAKNEHPRDWAKVIRDKSWRETTRKFLRTTGAQWCDYRAGECACD